MYTLQNELHEPISVIVAFEYKKATDGVIEYFEIYNDRVVIEVGEVVDIPKFPPVSNNSYTLHLYISTSTNHSKYRFRGLRMPSRTTLSLTQGEKYVILKCNGSVVVPNRVDRIGKYSPTLLCCCCNVKWTLNDIEQAEDDTSCVIL